MLMQWSFSGVGERWAPNFWSDVSTTLRDSSWSLSIVKAMLLPGLLVFGEGHRWELLGGGSCLIWAIVRMSGGFGTRSCFEWERRRDQAPRGKEIV